MGKMNKNRIALEPFLESVKEQCSCLSNEGLTEIILGLVKEIPAKQRAGFLRTIDRLSQEQPPAAWDEEILSQIEALEFISPKEKNQKPLLVEMLLMAGRIDTAFEKAGKIRALDREDRQEPNRADRFQPTSSSLRPGGRGFGIPGRVLPAAR